MRTYILKRFLLMPLTLLAITLISYTIMRVAPGKPVILRGGAGQEMKPGQLTAESYKLMLKAWHLDQSPVVGYWYWLGDMARGDFGISFTKKVPVRGMLAAALPVTLLLNVIAILVSYLLAVPLGLWSATRQGRWSDRVVTLVLFLLYSLPGFWLGLMLLWLFGKGGGWLELFPILSPNRGEGVSFLSFVSASLWHFVLPIICLTYAALASLSRYARVGLLEVLRQDYIRTARAKGLSEWRVIGSHAFRNSLGPLVTIIGLELPGLIGGSVIVESIFNIPGMGRMAFIALQDRDYNTLMAEFTLTAVLTLLGILLSDILYAVFDPRIDLEKQVQ